MDYVQIGQLVGSIGFPIVCCIVLFKQNSEFQKTLEKFSVTLNEISNEIKNLKNKLDKED